MKDFMIGASTAAHQVEGNNTHSDCWVLENLPHTMYKEKSGNGVDHYHRYEEDLDYLKNEGMNTYRFSIEWARIEPEEGVFDEKELQHYSDVLRACESRDITPIVTLHHFSSPAWLIRQGGWKSEHTVEAFAKYCRKVCEYYGNRLTYICTINEANMGQQINRLMQQYMQPQDSGGSSEGPQVGMNTDESMQYMMEGMKEAAEAFGRADVNSYLSGRNEEEEKLVMRAHQAAGKVISEVLPDAKIGLTLSLFDIQVLPGGEEQAEKLWYEDFGFYLPYMQNDDFIGVQNYTRKIVDANGEVSPAQDAKLTDSGYENYPEAIANVVRHVAKEWDRELIVTENGISTTDDTVRQEFIRTAMKGIHECLKEGINLKGYCHWSLLDNFEWQLGYGMQFGLIEVDRTTMERKVKPSLHVLSQEYQRLQEEI